MSLSAPAETYRLPKWAIIERSSRRWRLPAQILEDEEPVRGQLNRWNFVATIHAEGFQSFGFLWIQV